LARKQVARPRNKRSERVNPATERLIFPAGLDSLSASIRVPINDFDFSGALETLGHEETFEIREDRRVLSIDRGLSIARSHLRLAGQKRRTLVSASFTFDLEVWQPTLPLPFSPGSMVGDLPGVPQICGLDFAFTSRTESQLLHRAFITTYDVINQMVVRFLLGHSEVFSPSLPARLLELVNSQIPIFARKKPMTGEGRAP